MDFWHDIGADILNIDGDPLPFARLDEEDTLRELEDVAAGKIHRAGQFRPDIVAIIEGAKFQVW